MKPIQETRSMRSKSIRTQLRFALSILLTWLSCSLSFAQSGKIDASIHDVIWESDTIKDNRDRIAFVDSVLALCQDNSYLPGKLHAYSELGNIYRDIWLDSSSLYFQRGSEIVIDETDTNALELRARLFNDWGITLYRYSLLDSARAQHMYSIQLYEALDHHQGLAWNYNNLGIIYSERNQPDSARFFYEKSLESAIHIGDTVGIAFNKLNIGVKYIDEDRGNQAVEVLYEATQLFMKLGYVNLVARCYTNISRVYAELDPMRAYEYAILADSIYESGGNKYLLAHSSLALGERLMQLSEFREALEKFELSDTYFLSTNQASGRARAINEMALAYEKLNLLDSAIITLNRAEELVEKNRIEKEHIIRAIYTNKARIYNQFGNQGLSIQYAKKSLSLEVTQANHSETYEMHKLLSSLYSQTKDWEQAWHHLEIANTRELEWMRSNENKALAKQEAKFQYQQKEEQLLLQQAQEEALLQEKLKAQRLYNLVAVASLIFVMILVVLLYVNYIQKKRAADALRDQNTKIRAQKEELNKLGQFKEAMTGMIAHDLKNPLGVILATEPEQSSTRNMARQMLRLVENMLDVHKFEKTEVQLIMEPVLVSELIEEATRQIQVLLEESNIQVELKVDYDYHILADRDLLMRVMINLLTNAIKYSQINGAIIIGTKPDEGQIHLFVEDQGSGIPSDRIEEIFQSYQQFDPHPSGYAGSTGLGLTFCKLAIEAHGSLIFVESEIGKGSTFSFGLPMASEVSTAFESSQKYKLTITEADKKIILDLLPALRSYKLHQAMQIEDLLKPVREHNAATQEWVDSILNAAYLGNREHFEELVKDIEQP